MSTGKEYYNTLTCHVERATDLLKIIHTDVYGTMSVGSPDGLLNFITYTDDLSRYKYIYLMRHKSETCEKFKKNRMKYQIILAIKSGFCNHIVEENIELWV